MTERRPPRSADDGPSPEHEPRARETPSAGEARETAGHAEDRVLGNGPVELTVEARAHGWRIDYYLSRTFPNYSRSLFQKALAGGAVCVNGLPAKPSRRLRVGDRLSVRLPEEPGETVPAEDIPLAILYEDDDLVVVDKAAGMIVHPGKGNYGGTLAGALQFHFDELSDVAGKQRPGIVHRLDRDTSGVLVVAKNNRVHGGLSEQFQRREVLKEYRAIARGEISLESDYIETPVRVHPKHRQRMCVCKPGPGIREAVTFYEVIERFGGFTYVRLFPKTGRTHQLRLHMEHLGHPIVADRLYGGGASLRLSQVRLCTGAVSSREKRPAEDETLIERQALHAYRLEFRHPRSGQSMSFQAPLAQDFARTLAALREIRPER